MGIISLILRLQVLLNADLMTDSLLIYKCQNKVVYIY